VQTHLGIWDVGWSWQVFVLCFVLDDFRKYWLHRTQHVVRWFWAAHVTHHSSQHLNFATALRNPPTLVFTQAFLFRLPLALLGFPIEMVAFVGGLDSVYQFFVHTEIVRKLPWFIEAVMVTPSHHRVHHAANARYLDANYGAVFILWDRLFGSFVEEDEAEPCRYGLVRDLGTLSPWTATVHEWVALWRDLTQPGVSFAHRWRYLFDKPGYSHDGSRETSAMVKARVLAATGGDRTVRSGVAR
jgi:sterol desaturase/sphingolipid hydroxylase (fatty acid hydroxylase superfamily)